MSNVIPMHRTSDGLDREQHLDLVSIYRQAACRADMAGNIASACSFRNLAAYHRRKADRAPTHRAY